MDITQLVSTAVALVAIALVGVMAVVPSVMEAVAGRGEAHPTSRTSPFPAPRRRARHRPVDLAA